VYSNTLINNSLGINVTGNDTMIYYNRIVTHFAGRALTNAGINTYADYNWWGQNNIYPTVQGIDLDNWFVMSVSTDVVQNFVNPGDWLNYTYHFGLNTGGDFNPYYLPDFNVTINHNDAVLESFPAIETRSWQIPFNSTDFYFVSATLDNQASGFDVNNYSTRLVMGNYHVIVGDTVVLNATLTDAYGVPLVNHKVEFWINHVFIGSAYTDLDGVARFTYKTTSAGIVYLSARFNGGNYHPSLYSHGLTGSGLYRSSSNSTGVLYVSADAADIRGVFTNPPPAIVAPTIEPNSTVSTKLGAEYTYRYIISNRDTGLVNLSVKFVIPDGMTYVRSVASNQDGSVIRNSAGSSSSSGLVFNQKTNTLTWNIDSFSNRVVSNFELGIDVTLVPTKEGSFVIRPAISNSSKLNLKTNNALTINVKK